jgi:hypothetical protein
MAELILAPLLGAVGGALLPASATWGIAIGSAAGSLAGGLIGSAISAALFAPKAQSVEGPTLDSLKTMTADYGSGLGTGYGRVPGSAVVIDSFDLEPVKTTRKAGGGKKGGKAQRITTTSHRCCYAVAINHGTIHRVRQLRLSKKLAWDIATGKYDLIYDAEGREIGMRLHGLPADNVTVWFGHSTQPPDPMLVRRRGAGNVPAYRGVAYISIDRLNPENYGGAGNPTVETIFDSEPDAWSPRGFPGEAVGFATPGMPHPVPVSGGRWVTVGVQDDRLAARVWSVAPSRDGASPGAVVLGPTLPTGITAVGAAASRDGRLVGVVARKPDATDGALVAATFDADGGAWRGVDTVSGIAVGDMAGTGVFWLSEAVFAAVSAFPFEFDMGWHLWRMSGGAPRYDGVTGQSRGDYGLLQVLGCVPDGSGAAFVLYSTPSAAYGVRCARVAIAGTAGAPPVFHPDVALFGDTLPSRIDVHALNAAGTEWALCASSDAVFGSSVAAWVATVAPSSGTLSVTRPLRGVGTSAGSSEAPARPVFVGDGRIAVVSSTNRIAGVRLIPGGYEDAQAEESLPGSPIAPGASVGGGLPGWFATLGDDGQLRLARAWLPEGGIAIAEVLNRVCANAGYLAGEYDWSDAEGVVDGFNKPAGTNGRAVAENLSFVGGFETVLSGSRLVASPRTTEIHAEIPDHLAGTGERDSKEPVWRLAYTPGTKLPRSITVSHYDPARDFQTGSQESFRQVGQSEADRVLNLPFAISADRARGIADERLYQAHGEDRLLTGSVPLAYCWLDPGSNILYRGRKVRITRWRPGAGHIEFEGRPIVPVSADYRAPTSGGDYTPQTWSPPSASDLLALDLPLLDPDGVDDMLGLRLAVSSARTPWPGATVYTRDGSDFEAVMGTGTTAAAGYAETALPPGPWAYPDEASSVVVRVPPAVAERIVSASREAWLEGANACLLGDEILRFRVAEQLDETGFSLRGLLRGRRGTEAAVGTHADGETFVLLDDAVRFVDLESRRRGRPLALRAVTVGTNIGDAVEETVTPTGRSMQPFAPVHVRGTRTTGGDLTVTWYRRARLDAELRDWTDVPLDEPQELYDVEVLDGPGGLVVRTARTTAPTWTYTSAMQADDLGSVPAEVHLRVYQISTRVGRGLPAVANI